MSFEQNGEIGKVHQHQQRLKSSSSHVVVGNAARTVKEYKYIAININYSLSIESRSFVVVLMLRNYL